MKILTKAKLPDGTKIQIEDWDETFNSEHYGSTLVVYPIAIASLNGLFSPKEGKEFRCQFNFENYDETKQALDNLVNGTKQLSDFKDYLHNPEYIYCIPHSQEDIALFEKNKKRFYRQQLELTQKNKIRICSLEIANEVDCILFNYFSDQDFEKACELIELAYLKSEDLSINQLTRSLEFLLKFKHLKLEDITRKQLIEEACFM